MWFQAKLYDTRPAMKQGLDQSHPLRVQTCLFSSQSPEVEVDSPDSLFDESLESPGTDESLSLVLPPPIPGLFYDPNLRVPPELAQQVADFCLKTYFTSPEVNQVMLFTRSHHELNAPFPGPPLYGLPVPLQSLMSALSGILKPLLPAGIYDLLFPPNTTLARQAIINLYQPGEGISPHVDLLKRYGDGIIGVSILGTCAMQFARVADSDCLDPVRDAGYDAAVSPLGSHNVFLPEGSVFVLSGEARYNWTHGIQGRMRDYVMLQTPDTSEAVRGLWVERGVRLSVTFRWMLPGADVVGSE